METDSTSVPQLGLVPETVIKTDARFSSNRFPYRTASINAGRLVASETQFVSPVGLVDVLVQQEARLRTRMCGRRPRMQEQGMHQDHVTSQGSILDDLERPIDLFDAFVKPRDPRFRIARGVQIPEVRVPFERFTELRTSSLW